MSRWIGWGFAAFLGLVIYALLIGAYHLAHILAARPDVAGG